MFFIFSCFKTGESVRILSDTFRHLLPVTHSRGNIDRLYGSSLGVDCHVPLGRRLNWKTHYRDMIYPSDFH